MKLFLILSLFLFPIISSAGLPPTTVKDSGDSSPITTFNFLFPHFTGSHAGVNYSLGINGIAGGGTNSAASLNNNRVMQSVGGAIVESAAITAARALVSDSNGIPVASTVSTTSLQSLLTGLSGDVSATGPGTVDSVVALTAYQRYVNFVTGNDSTGTGSVLRPWKTVAHACASISPTINTPYTIHLDGGNNDTDASPISCPPNITLTAPYAIQVSQPVTITGGITNDNVEAENITFLGTFTWVRSDATLCGFTAINAEFFSGPVVKQSGSGYVNILMIDVPVTLNAEFGPHTGYVILDGANLLGTTTFDDATSAAYYQFQSGYNDGLITVNGGPTLYLGGFICDQTLGCALTVNTTANGTATIVTDSGSIPASITGSPTLILNSLAKYTSYAPSVSSDWGVVPSLTSSALDDLASSGIFKSQSANKLLASPNGSSGVPSFRSIVTADLPTVDVPHGGTGQTSLTAHGVVVGNTASAVNVTSAGTSGQVLTSNGASADPTFQALPAGGGGGALNWLESTNAPISMDYLHGSTAQGILVYAFSKGLSQQLFGMVQIPSSYQAGNPIKLKTSFVSGDAPNTVLMKTLTTLFRPGVDVLFSTTNQRTSTNSAVVASATPVPQSITLDLTDSTGHINAVAVSPGDLIKIQLYRDPSDTSNLDADVPAYASEVTFQ